MWFTKNNNNPISTTSASASSNEPTISLEKSKVALDKSIVNLSKQSGVNLDVHKAKVAVVMDKSGSMQHHFYSGGVQAILNRLLPLAVKFDDNGELETFVFNTDCQLITPAMTLDNFSTYVETQILGKGHSPIGGTRYAPVIKTTMKKMACFKSEIPIFVIVVTDGDNNDKLETDESIRKSSEFPIFYQFIGIGHDTFNYLQKLDNLSGRKVDNTAFINCRNIASMSDDELYAKLLEQYPQWLKDIHFI